MKNAILSKLKCIALSPKQLVWTHVILQTLDWFTTLVIILNTHTELETNPVVRLILEAPGGMWLFTAVKAIVCGMIAWVLPWSLTGAPRWVSLIWELLAIVYLVIVLNNLVGVVYVYTLL